MTKLKPMLKLMDIGDIIAVFKMLTTLDNTDTSLGKNPDERMKTVVDRCTAGKVISAVWRGTWVEIVSGNNSKYCTDLVVKKCFDDFRKDVDEKISKGIFVREYIRSAGKKGSGDKLPKSLWIDLNDLCKKVNMPNPVAKMYGEDEEDEESSAVSSGEESEEAVIWKVKSADLFDPSFKYKPLMTQYFQGQKAKLIEMDLPFATTGNDWDVVPKGGPTVLTKVFSGLLKAAAVVLDENGVIIVFSPLTTNNPKTGYTAAVTLDAIDDAGLVHMGSVAHVVTRPDFGKSKNVCSTFDSNFMAFYVLRKPKGSPVLDLKCQLHHPGSNIWVAEVRASRDVGAPTLHCSHSGCRTGIQVVGAPKLHCASN
jgi:hypothetical protein